MTITKSLQLRKWYLLISGLLLGILVILAIRFVTYKPVQVHYHANFAVYLNGQREAFKGPQYYQEVAICSGAHGITIPQQRAHMHDNLNSVIHIHDHAVTWGQFFENLGWTIGPDLLETDNGTKYMSDDTNKLHIILNGQDYTDLTPITNMIIKDKARLLVSYGNIDTTQLQQEFNTVPATAAHYDASQDPASCSGDEKVNLSERLHHLF